MNDTDAAIIFVAKDDLGGYEPDASGLPPLAICFDQGVHTSGRSTSGMKSSMKDCGVGDVSAAQTMCT